MQTSNGGDNSEEEVNLQNEENNNNLEIEENNNYQELQPLVCAGCSCRLANHNRVNNLGVEAACICAPRSICCYIVRPSSSRSNLEEEPRPSSRNTQKEDSDVEIISFEEKRKKEPEEESERPKKRLRKLYPVISPVRLSIKTTPLKKKKLPLSLTRKRKAANKEKNEEEEPPKKAPRTEIAFVSCEVPLPEEEPENPSLPKEEKKVLNKKDSDPLGKLSLSSKEKRLAVDSLAGMYDHRQFAESSGVVATTGFYNPNKLPSNAITDDLMVGSNSNTQNASGLQSNHASSAAAAAALDSNKTIATLCNIGNSCYLNSVVYTLRFAPLFVHKFHHFIEDMATISVKLNPTEFTKSSSLRRNVSLWSGHSGRSWSSKDLASLGASISSLSSSSNGGGPSDGAGATTNNNKNNRLIVVEKLHELYQNLHKNEATLNSEPLHAGAFLQAIQEVSSIFEGNQQQDAHEFLMCILDSIRETCDTLATAIIDNPELLLAEYGVNTSALLDEARDEVTPISSSTSSSSAAPPPSVNQLKVGLKLFSRKSKRKKSEDEKMPDSPIKESSGAGSGNGGEDSETTSPTDPSAAPTPVPAPRTAEDTKSLLLKALFGSNTTDDITQDKEKLKKAVCQRLGLNFFNEDFEGVSVSSIKCLTCETVRNCEETMIDVSVPITGHENPDSMNNPQLFFQNSFITKEYFRGENKYRCESCYGYTEAIRSISYEVLPRLLVIHLKRFSGGMEKINSYIPTPFTLHCFCNRCIGKRDDEKLHIYKLYSVITHVGATMSVGHYVAYTCSLDIMNEANQCINQLRDKLNAGNHQKLANGGINGAGTGAGGETNGSRMGGSHNGAGSGDKKRGFRGLFSNRKTNSSGDITKSLKSVNGIVNKVVSNGIEKLSLNGASSHAGNHVNSAGTNSACQGAKCCGIHVKNSKLLSNNTNTCTSTSANGTNSFVSYLNGNGSESQNGHGGLTNGVGVGSGDGPDQHHNGGGGSGAGASNLSHISQDFWYMCDDDKIKVMSQQQFEENLSPNRKNMITPYLLFYARFNTNNQM